VFFFNFNLKFNLPTNWRASHQERALDPYWSFRRKLQRSQHHLI